MLAGGGGLGRVANLPASAGAGGAGASRWRTEQRLADVPELRARIDAMRVEANFLAEGGRSRPSPLLVLEALSSLLPDSVWLSEIALEGRGL